MKKLLAALVLTAGLGFGAQVSVGIRFGTPPPPPRAYRRPPPPASGYFWVDGYWYPNGRRYVWHNGYWSRPPYDGARWIAPRYESGMFYNGYWDAGGRRFDHDHRWDHDRNHDYGHDRDDRRDRDRH